MKGLELVAEISLCLMNAKNFSDRMNSVLRLTGEYTQVSRTYIFIDNREGTATSNTFEWCNTGVDPQIDDLQNIPYSVIPSFKTLFREEGRIYSENISNLPEDLRAVLEPQNIKSIVIYPLIIRGEPGGFIGFDECRNLREWDEEYLNLLKTISSIVSFQYEERSIVNELKESKTNFENLFNTIEDLMIIGNTDGTITFANRAAMDKLGYTHNELMRMNIVDLYLKEESDDIKNLFENAALHIGSSSSFALRSNEGRRIPVETRFWLGKWNNENCIFSISHDLTVEYEALQKFTKLFDNNPALMAVTSYPDRKIMNVNSAFLKTFGYSREEVLGENFGDLKIFADPEEHQQIVQKLIDSGKVAKTEIRARNRSGAIIHGLFSGDIFDSQGVRFYLLVMIDITEQKRLQEVFNQQRLRFLNIIEGTRLGTWEWNIQSGETAFNERWAQIIGYTLDELSPVSIETWKKYAHPEDFKGSEAALTAHFNGETDYYSFECRMKHKTGKWVWVLDRGKVIQWDRDGAPLKMYGTHTDITEQKEMELRLQEIAVRDPLTNIFNRRYIFEQIEKEISRFLREGSPFAAAIADIDHFKQVNDRYSHLAGDFILKEFSKLLSEQIRPYDLLGRFGGEEFIIIAVGSNKFECADRFKKILERVRNTAFTFEDIQIDITFSCGISDISEIDTKKISVESILSLADSRLYTVKERSRNDVLCE